MGSYRITREIRATPVQVFRAFTDPGLIADWMDAAAINELAGSLAAPGASYTMIIRGPWRFKVAVVRSEPPWLHETVHRGPLGTRVRILATLSARDGGTHLDLLTEYAMPLGPIGRWIDRRWIDREPHVTANREVDRLVELVSQPGTTPQRRGRAVGADGRSVGLDEAVERAQRALLDREIPGWSSRRLRWSGGETQVIEAGAGTPILLVHGGMGNAADWAPLIARLAAHRTVFAVDRPGHGLATAFEYRGVDLWRHAATFLREVLDALALERVDVAGCSMGGLFGVALAEAHPERVRSLALVGAPAGAQRALPSKIGTLAWPIAGSLVTTMIRRSTAASTRSFWDGLIVAHPERLSDQLLEFVALAARRNAEGWHSIVREGATIRGIRPRYLLAAHVARLTVPVAFVWGEHDAFTAPEAGRQLAAVTRQPGPFIVIPDAGHLPWLDEPDLVASALLSALTSLSTATSLIGLAAEEGARPTPVAV